MVRPVFVGALQESQFFLPALVAMLAYLLGSIPFGLLLTRAAGLGDVRAIGSGNIGATNVLRTGNKGLAAATLLLDGGKGAVAVLLARLLTPDPDWLDLVAAGAVLLGHCYPVWLRFRGGKGVATFFGIAFALWWPMGLLAALLWLGVTALTRRSSAGGLAAANGAPVAAWLLGQQDLALFFMAAAVLIDWKHRANIARLANGTEPRIGAGKAGGSGTAA
jgi:glycerol-3-phosphate acyltransferase PlsY